MSNSSPSPANPYDPTGIPWPAMPGSADRPFWTGKHFVVGTTIRPFLQYGKSAGGWSDEMAELIQAESGAGHPLAKASLRRAERALRKGLRDVAAPRVLEIGCGTGAGLASLRRALPNVFWVGMEYAEPALAHLVQAVPDVPFVQADITACPLPDSLFDAIVCRNVVEHIADDLVALQEIRRLLRPGGVLVLEVPAAPALYDSFDRLVGHHRRYRLRELVELCHCAGLKTERASHLGFFVFPAAWVLKRVNQRFMEAPIEEQWARVRRTIRAGRQSRFMRMLLRIEDIIETRVPLPFGLRCTITARRSNV